MKKYIFISVISLVALAGISINSLIKFSDNKLHIVFCDVGQGDGIFMRTPRGVDILIDGGPDDNIVSCLERHMPFWDRDIELMFATHPDADHITGLESVLKNYTVKSFNTSQKSHETAIFKRIYALLEENNIPIKYLYVNDTFKTEDGVTIKNFWPSDSFVNIKTTEELDTNSFSLVQLLTFNKFKALFTGDIEFGILNNIMSLGIDVDVLKLPHHGSKTGVDALSFELIKPKISIISSGRKNKYNHPSPEVISLLKKYNLEYLNTASKGDIEIVSDGNGFSVVN